MTLRDDWADGDTVHGTDLNDIADNVNFLVAAAANAIISQPSGAICTLPRARSDEAPVSSGELNLTYFQAPAAYTVHNATIFTGDTAAAGVTVAKIGIFSVDESANLTLIGSTPNTPTIAAATYTSYDTALSAPVTFTQGLYYAAGILIAATTPPSLAGNYVLTDANLAPRLCGQLSGQADLPSTIAAADVANNYRVFYTRIS